MIKTISFFCLIEKRDTEDIIIYASRNNNSIAHVIIIHHVDGRAEASRTASVS